MSEQSLELRRSLYSSRPEKIRRSLAETSFNLASHLREAGRIEESVQSLDEALRHFRVLSKRHGPASQDRMAQGLALRSLNDLTLGRLQPALQGVDQALHLQRAALALESTDIARLGFVQVSMRWLLVSAEIDSSRELSAIAAETVAVCRVLVGHSRHHRPVLAQALRNYGSVVSRSQQNEGAEAPYREALAIYEDLEDEAPVWNADLALTARDLAVALAATGRLQEALCTSERALRWLKFLDLPDPEPAWIVALRSEHAEYRQRMGRPSLELD